MSNGHVINADSYRAYNSWHAIVAALLALLLLLLPWLFGIGPSSWRTCVGSAVPSAASPVVVPAVPSSEPAAPATTREPAVASPAASAGVEALPSARVYFDVDKTDLPGDADATLAAVVAYLKAHPGASAVLSGYHDPQGKVSREYNEQLALDRARAVRGALDRLGIPNGRVVMEKPRETTGSGSNDEARRVEVSIRP